MDRSSLLGAPGQCDRRSQVAARFALVGLGVDQELQGFLARHQQAVRGPPDAVVGGLPVAILRACRDPIRALGLRVGLFFPLGAHGLPGGLPGGQVAVRLDLLVADAGAAGTAHSLVGDRLGHPRRALAALDGQLETGGPEHACVGLADRVTFCFGHRSLLSGWTPSPWVTPAGLVAGPLAPTLNSSTRRYGVNRVTEKRHWRVANVPRVSQRNNVDN